MHKTIRKLISGFVYIVLTVGAFSNRPNILFIYTDDQSRDEFNFVSEGKILNDVRNYCPNIDMLCNEGTVFPNFYLSTAACTPSRYSVLTGLYASRSLDPTNFEDSLATVTWNTKIGKNDEHTASVLKKAGYYTGFVGKNHTYALKSYKINPEADPRDPIIKKQLKNNQKELINTLKNVYEYDYAASIYQGNPINRALPKELQVHNLDWIVKGAMDFLDEAQLTGKPFYLHLATTITHKPNSNGTAHKSNPRNTPLGFIDTPLKVMPPRESIDIRVKNAEKKLSQADITWLDDAIGTLLNKLTSLEEIENTIILYFSDNGPSPGKCSLYETGVKSFGFIWGYGNKGVFYNKNVSNIDIAPTIFEMAGINKNNWPVMDGTSMVGIINDTSKTLHNSLYFESGYTRGIIKNNMKYIAFRLPESKKRKHYFQLGIVDGGMHVERAAAEAYPYYFDEDQLYDILEKDENFNLAHDTSYKLVVADLKLELQKYLCRLPGKFAEFKSDNICNKILNEFYLFEENHKADSEIIKLTGHN